MVLRRDDQICSANTEAKRHIPRAVDISRPKLTPASRRLSRPPRPTSPRPPRRSSSASRASGPRPSRRRSLKKGIIKESGRIARGLAEGRTTTYMRWRRGECSPFGRFILSLNLSSLTTVTFLIACRNLSVARASQKLGLSQQERVSIRAEGDARERRKTSSLLDRLVPRERALVDLVHSGQPSPRSSSPRDPAIETAIEVESDASSWLSFSDASPPSYRTRPSTKTS